MTQKNIPNEEYQKLKNMNDVLNQERISINE